MKLKRRLKQKIFILHWNILFVFRDFEESTNTFQEKQSKQKYYYEMQ